MAISASDLGPPFSVTKGQPPNQVTVTITPEEIQSAYADAIATGAPNPNIAVEIYAVNKIVDGLGQETIDPAQIKIEFDSAGNCTDFQVASI